MTSPFRHMLAYGNSDQASFRNDEVRHSFDVMTVPGTIAAYYNEATAAFVLSIQIDYLIDPRTPLFQEELPAIRASHNSLAEWHGPDVVNALAGGAPVAFPVAFWTDAVVATMTAEVIGRQRSYADNAPAVQTKLDRYARLLAEALQEQGAPAPLSSEAHPPYCILAPYFAVSGESDPWWRVVEGIWQVAAQLPDPNQIVPVLCVDGREKIGADGVATLEALLPRLPQDLSQICFFWITNFDERKVSEAQLRRLWQVVEGRPAGRRLVNMYGGFFSICLRYAGLRGFGNGLTYSESRDWPALSSTGAAPPRYYVRDLHTFVSLALAESLVESDRSFECPCSACEDHRASGRTLASLPYHDLKRHFALARRWELEQTAAQTPGEIADSLEGAKRRLDGVRRGPVLSALPSGEYLNRWAAVLRRH